ncbi:MAG: T9SS type A sorting domain-containing protein [Ignavibacteriaceae bacterium]|nr:T9SS type A sorting domain-containing protein [Ignavibacteriaceae bacterium]
MKKSYLLVLFSLLFLPLSFSYGQLFVENFDYPVGDSLTQHGWISHSGSDFAMFVVNGSLSYTGYPSSGIGNSTIIDCGGGSRQDVHVEFTSIDTIAIYASFLIKIDSASTTGEYFFHFSENPWSNLFRARVFARNDGSGNIQFGLSKASTSTVEWTTTTYTFGNTYLLVTKYEFIGDLTGSDDVVKLYINPDVSSPEPVVPDLTNSDTNTDIAVGAVAMRQGFNQLTLQIDGMRVATIWDLIVPVELTSFTAISNRNTITLNWSTASELNNQGFEIQRSNKGSDFESIGFTPGYGTSTETKNYSYVDANLSSGTYAYRLKQFDFDGTFSYSDIVNVDVTGPMQFELSQNYPNPFNPSTTINFSIPQSSNVTLKVFNTLGQEVATLVNQNMESGVHTINFDASALNSGIYFYRLDAGQYSDVRKMTLIK